jgi:hypothetical protein
MSKFQIVNPGTGIDLGTYEGATKAEALDAYARDAGYESFASACEATGDDPERDADLRVTEVAE